MSLSTNFWAALRVLTAQSAKLYEIGAGTSEVRRIVLGRAFNKEYSSYVPS